MQGARGCGAGRQALALAAVQRIRVGIDGFNIALPEGTGVATYGRALAEAVRGMGHAVDGVFGLPNSTHPFMAEVLFFEALELGGAQPFGFWPRKLRHMLETRQTYLPSRLREVPRSGVVERDPMAHRLPAFDRIWSTHRLFARAERFYRRTGRFVTIRVPDPPDVMHWTYPMPIRMGGTRNLYTLHDLVPLRLPYATLDRKRRYLKLVRRCARRADAIVTVSEASRRDIVDVLGVSPGKVHNTYQALPATVPTPGAAAALGLEPEGYFLFFGAIEPKKNVGRLLEAYLAADVSTPLVIVGGQGWGGDRDTRMLGPMGELRSPVGRKLSRRVIRLSYLPRRMLMGLVADARAVLFPSLYEGFGLPVLEGMRLGTPVMTADTSSLPEVAGDAAVLVDPLDVRAMSAAIRQLDADAGLRRDLSERGLARAEMFSAERYAERLAAVYDGL